MSRLFTRNRKCRPQIYRKAASGPLPASLFSSLAPDAPAPAYSPTATALPSTAPRPRPGTGCALTAPGQAELLLCLLPFFLPFFFPFHFQLRHKIYSARCIKCIGRPALGPSGSRGFPQEWPGLTQPGLSKVSRPREALRWRHG